MLHILRASLFILTQFFVVKLDNVFAALSNITVRVVNITVGPYTKNHCMSWKLIFDKFEGADFKYGNIIVKIQPKTTKIKHFYFLNKILLLDEIEGADFK